MEFRIEKAEAKDAEAIACLIQQCYEKMEHKDWYFPDDARYMRELLAPAKACTGMSPGGRLHGMAYKAISIDNNRLAGIFTVAFPGDSPKNMGYDLGFSSSQCRLLAHMDSAAVLPEYRGHRLQYRLMSAAEAELNSLGFRYLAATVHPDNHSSKETMLRLGYQVKTTKEKYNGRLRDIMLKTL